MSQAIYKVWFMRYKDAWYTLSPEEQKKLMDKNEALMKEVGGELVLMAAYYFVVTAKHRSMVSAHRGLDAVRWEHLDWTPPKLILSNFRVPGKVCPDLTALEAARNVHTHPTLSESVQEAFHGLAGHMINL